MMLRKFLVYFLSIIVVLMLTYNRPALESLHLLFENSIDVLELFLKKCRFIGTTGGVLWVEYILHTLSTSLGKKRVVPGIVLLFVLQGGKLGGIPLDVTTKRLNRAGGTGEWQDRRWGLEWRCHHGRCD
jgi:hypothetical protein